jgi:hypothetical protein
LAQALEILLPDGVWPDKSPKDFLEEFVSVDAMEKFYLDLPNSEGTTPGEIAALDRFGEMLNGKYRRGLGDYRVRESDSIAEENDDE